MSQVTGRWLRFLQRPAGARSLAVCFPPTGAHGATFANWSGRLADDLALAVVDPPGRGARLNEEPVTRIADYIAAVAESLEADGTGLVLIGVSLGGVLAFETCRALLDRGLEVDRLCVVAGPAPPACTGNDGEITVADARAFVLEAGLTASELLAHPEFENLLLPPVLADLRLRATYDGRKASAIPVPILACWADEDSRAPCDVVQAWSAFSSVGCTFHELSGSHYVHQTDPDQVISACLSEGCATTRAA